MLYSMTGFGRAESGLEGRQITVELKSLNGKQFDVNLRLPSMLRPYEAELRSMLSTAFVRGTVDVSISISQEGAVRPMMVNTVLARHYYEGMKQIADELGITPDNVLSTLMRMPEVVAQEQDALPENQWLRVKELVQQAVERLAKHRQVEGAILEKELLLRIEHIEALLQKILPLEGPRTERVRQKMQQAFKDARIENADANRFEQELIYYIEKIDFAEEKLRLQQHCDYFKDTLGNDSAGKGKILGFILQEVGREINTLGSKANDATIQQYVVQMKDELEKAKEQVLNVL